MSGKLIGHLAKSFNYVEFWAHRKPWRSLVIRSLVKFKFQLVDLAGTDQE